MDQQCCTTKPFLILRQKELSPTSWPACTRQLIMRKAREAANGRMQKQVRYTCQKIASASYTHMCATTPDAISMHFVLV